MGEASDDGCDMAWLRAPLLLRQRAAPRELPRSTRAVPVTPVGFQSLDQPTARSTGGVHVTRRIVGMGGYRTLRVIASLRIAGLAAATMTDRSHHRLVAGLTFVAGPTEPRIENEINHQERTPVGKSIDLRRYHNLSERISVYSVDGGALVRGSGEDVRVEDGEPALESAEEERFRLAGHAQLIGPRTDGGGDVTLGLAANGRATFVVTTDRIITMFLHPGQTVDGSISADEVHVFVFPWDLIDSLSMPKKKKMADRIAGNRTIDLFAGTIMVSLRIVPLAQEGNGGSTLKIADDEALRILTQVAARHRLSVSPESEHGRLENLLKGEVSVSDDEFVAAVTDEDTTDIPTHLLGRLVGHDLRDGAGDEVVPAPPVAGPATASFEEPASYPAAAQAPVPMAGPGVGSAGVAFTAERACARCGAGLEDDQFCRRCGTAAPAVAPDATCDGCAALLYDGDAFCTGCGQEVPTT